MPDDRDNLYLFEAIELRDEYDRHIELLARLVGRDTDSEDEWARPVAEGRQPAADVDLRALEKELKQVRTRRVKLNQAIQIANFEARVDHEGEALSLAEALEVRKHLAAEVRILGQRVNQAAFTRVIHKEKRDIVVGAEYAFAPALAEYRAAIRRFRRLVTGIHRANHHHVVKFKDE